MVTRYRHSSVITICSCLQCLDAGFGEGGPKLAAASGGHEVSSAAAELLRQAEQRALTTLTNHRIAQDRLTTLLLERETIDGPVVDDILGCTNRCAKARSPDPAVRHNLDGVVYCGGSISLHGNERSVLP
jgi:ATP-dependent Zn protease